MNSIPLILRWLFLLLCSSYLSAQNVAINNIIATDFTTSDDDVLEIKFGDHLPNYPFIVAWIDASGKQYALQFITTEGKLVVPLSGQPGWKGEIGLIGLSINDVEATIRASTFGDGWRTFMIAHPITPGSVNFTQAYDLFGYPLRRVCLALMILLTIIMSILKKQYRIPLLLAFLISFSVYDIRSAKNRWDIMTYLSAQEYEVDIFKDLDKFLTGAREIIGQGTWTKEPLSGVLNSYCTYQLADIHYIPLKPEGIKKADFVITTKPRNRKIVHNHDGYFLIELNNAK